MADLLFDTVFRQSKAACLQRLLQSSFAVFCLILKSARRTRSANKWRTTFSAVLKSASKLTAANIASIASASIEGRLKPPLFNSPAPKYRPSPTFISAAISASTPSLTRLARNRDNSPSVNFGNASNSIRATV